MNNEKADFRIVRTVEANNDYRYHVQEKTKGNIWVYGEGDLKLGFPTLEDAEEDVFDRLLFARIEKSRQNPEVVKEYII